MGYLEELRKKVGHVPIILNSAGIIIKNEQNEVLLQYRKDTHNWGLPGGYMELGESFEDTVKREIKEEMGIEVECLSLLKVFSGRDFFHDYPNGDQVYSVIAVYMTNEIKGKPQADQKEIRDIQFFSLDALPEEMTLVTEEILNYYRKEGQTKGLAH